VSNRPIGDIIHQLQEKTATKGLSDAIKDGRPWNDEMWITRADGSQTIIELAVTRIKIDRPGESETHFDLYMGRNITREKGLERRSSQIEKMAVRGEMAGEIAHEMNNYLSVVYGNLELLGMALDRGAYEGLSNRVKSMRDGLDRITRFVEGMMSVPKPETEKEVIDINKFLNNEILLIKSQPGFEDIDFNCHLSDGIPPLEVDSAQLQQVFFHLINNANDSLARNPQGQKRISIATEYSPLDNRAKVTLADNGPGMADEDYGKVFRSLFTTKKVGHGFNLLTVKRVIKFHGGKISAVKGPDGGACFMFELPCKKVVEQTKKAVKVA
jgi:signal transduction histidine kinase